MYKCTLSILLWFHLILDTPQVINLSCETRSQVSSTRSSNGTQCTVEEYIYTDNEASVRLVEWRCPPNQNVSPSIRQNVSASILSTSSVSDWRSYATCDYESEDDIQVDTHLYLNGSGRNFSYIKNYMFMERYTLTLLLV